MSKENKIVELKDEELKQVTGGGYHGEIVDYIEFPPNVWVYTIEQRRIDIGLIVRRVVDRKQFRCVGYENNNDGTTTWVFNNESGSAENIIFCACVHGRNIHDVIISEFCLT